MATAHSHSDHTAKTTTDHDEIRKWVEARGGKPATVKSTHGKHEAGILRIEFPGAPNAHDENLEPIDWDEFFAKFDEAELAFLHQDHTAADKESRFFKFVRR